MERWLQEENLGTFSHMITRAHALLHNDESRSWPRLVPAPASSSPTNFRTPTSPRSRFSPASPERMATSFAVGDPDQAIYRFRGASSAAFELFHRHFPGAKRVVLEKNRRSTTPILRSAFALINENPPVFAKQSDGALAYRRTPLAVRARRRSLKPGMQLPSPPVSAVILTSRRRRRPRSGQLHPRRAEEVEVQMVGLRHPLPLSLSAG